MGFHLTNRREARHPLRALIACPHDDVREGTQTYGLVKPALLR